MCILKFLEFYIFDLLVNPFPVGGRKTTLMPAVSICVIHTTILTAVYVEAGLDPSRTGVRAIRIDVGTVNGLDLGNLLHGAVELQKLRLELTALFDAREG